MSSRILIVEDDPLISMMLEEYLTILGRAPAGAAETVDAALTLIRAGGFDAAIVDVHLANGETSGPVAVELGSAGTPFLVSTGGFIGTPGDWWRDHPMLLKPFTAKTLEEALVSIGA